MYNNKINTSDENIWIINFDKTIDMIFAKPNHVPTFVLEKLQFLLALLTEPKREFETFARGLKDRPLRRTVLELAQECNQYAHELLSQLETMTGEIIYPDERECLEDKTLLTSEDDILQSCQLSEQKVIIATGVF